MRIFVITDEYHDYAAWDDFVFDIVAHLDTSFDALVQWLAAEMVESDHTFHHLDHVGPNCYRIYVQSLRSGYIAWDCTLWVLPVPFTGPVPWRTF